MSAEDYIPDLFDHEWEDEDELARGEVRCSYCRERDLYWSKDGPPFVLVDEDGEPHRCPKGPQQGVSAADFDDFDD